jgi:hypothetical protein
MTAEGVEGERRLGGVRRVDAEQPVGGVVLVGGEGVEVGGRAGEVAPGVVGEQLGVVALVVEAEQLAGDEVYSL